MSENHQIWIGVSKKATRRPRIRLTMCNKIQNGGFSSVNFYKTVFMYFFTHSSFPCTIISWTMSPKKENRTLACINWLDYDQGGRGKFGSERRTNSETEKICWLYNEVSFYFIITFGKRKSLEIRHIHVRYTEVPLACNKHQLNNSSLYIGVPTTWYRICKLSPCSKFSFMRLAFQISTCFILPKVNT